MAPVHPSCVSPEEDVRILLQLEEIRRHGIRTQKDLMLLYGCLTGRLRRPDGSHYENLPVNNNNTTISP